MEPRAPGSPSTTTLGSNELLEAPIDGPSCSSVKAPDSLRQAPHLSTECRQLVEDGGDGVAQPHEPQPEHAGRPGAVCAGRPGALFAVRVTLQREVCGAAAQRRVRRGHSLSARAHTRLRVALRPFAQASAAGDREPAPPGVARATE